MNKRKLSILMLSVIIASSALLGACKTKPSSTDTVKPAANADPFGKYETTIDQTAIRIKTSWMTLDGTDDENNNVWSRKIKDELNINVKQLWTAPNWGQPFDEKVNLAISSDELPDIIPVYTTLFFRIAQGNKAADLTKIYEQYASPRLKEIMQINNGVALKSATFDGKLYGLGQPGDYGDRTFLWLRKDWMDKLGLQAPKTLDDLYAIAKAFVTRDPNGNGKADEIGFDLTKDFFGGQADVARIFNAYGLYPRTWADKDGKLVRTETQPEFKTVLKKLAELYKEGLIPKDFTIKDLNKEVQEDFKAGRVGIAFGGPGTPSAPAIKESHDKNGADWVAYEMPTATGKIIKMPFDSRVGNFYAVSAKNKHPEAAIKILNLQLEMDAFNEKYVKDNSFNMSPSGKMNFWCKPANLNDPRNSSIKNTKVLEALYKGGDVSKLNFEQKEEYDKVKKGDWDYATTYKQGGAMELAKGTYKDAAWLSPAWGAETPAWVQSGQDLHVKAQEFFIKAVLSGNVDKEFDAWVNYWNTQGGKEATNEINDWYSKNKTK